MKVPLRPLPLVATDACEAPLVDRAWEYESDGAPFRLLDIPSLLEIPEPPFEVERSVGEKEKLTSRAERAEGGW
jgi:hypothetical protein